MSNIRGIIAHQRSRQHLQFYRTNYGVAYGLHVSMINRLWGHSMARSWARLVLDRLREYVGPLNPYYRRHHQDTSVDLHEEYLFFNPILPMTQ